LLRNVSRETLLKARAGLFADAKPRENTVKHHFYVRLARKLFNGVQGAA
jgi:hypothetical protein